MLKVMKNSIVYPFGFSVTYQRHNNPMVPNGFALNLIWWSICFWLRRSTYKENE